MPGVKAEPSQGPSQGSIMEAVDAEGLQHFLDLVQRQVSSQHLLLHKRRQAERVSGTYTCGGAERAREREAEGEREGGGGGGRGAERREREREGGRAQQTGVGERSLVS